MSKVIKGAILQDSPKVLENPAIYVVRPTQDESELNHGDIATAYAVMLEEQNRKAMKILEDAEIQRNLMITDAQKQAEKILVNAGQEAEQMKIMAHKEATEVGYAEGHDHGYKVAKDEMANLIKEANEKAERTVLLAENEIKDSVLKAEGKIVEIVMAIANKVIPQHFIDVPQIILPLVRSALEKVRDQRDIIIKVSPDDYELVLMAKKEFQSMLDSDNQLTISTDQTLTNGNCIIESANGNVDARVSTQMEAVKKAIQEVI